MSEIGFERGTTRSHPDQLTTRHIKSQAHVYGWRAHVARGVTGALYPVFDPLTGDVLGTRFTVFDAADVKTLGAKYLWVPTKPASSLADWYILPARDGYVGAAAAIRAADGTAWLANGEKSLLAFVAAGVENVVATTHGEQTVPDLSALLQLGVSTLINVYDADDTGRKAAERWAKRAQAAGIRVITKRWPVTAARGYDAGDAWMDAQQQPQPEQFFRLFLEQLPTVEFEAVAPKAARGSQQANDDLAKRVIAAYEAQHGPVIWQTNRDYSKNVMCLFHEDAKPSAGFSKNGGMNCFACGFHPVFEVANALGVDLELENMFVPKRRARTNLAAAPDTLPGDYLQQAKNDSPDEEDAPDTDGALDQTWQDYAELQRRRVWLERPTIALFSALNTIFRGYGMLFLQLQKALREGTLSMDGFLMMDAIACTGRNRRTVQHFMTRTENVLIRRITSDEYFARVREYNTNTISPTSAKNSDSPDARNRQLQKNLGPGRPAFYYVPIALNVDLLVERLSYALKQRFYGLKRHGDEMFVALGQLDQAFLAQISANVADLQARRETLTRIEQADPAGAALGRYAHLTRHVDRALARHLDNWRGQVGAASLFVPAFDVKSDMSYRDFVFRYVYERIEEAGTLTITQQAFADELGISANTIRSAVERLNIRVTRNEALARLNVRADAPESDIQARIDELAKKYHGQPISWQVSLAAPSGDIPVRRYPVYPGVAGGIRKTLREAKAKNTPHVVDLLIRQANSYTITEPVPAVLTPKTPVAKKPQSAKKPERGDYNVEAQPPVRRAQIHIARFDDDDAFFYSGHYVVEQMLGLCGMMLVDGQARAMADWRIVVFDRVDDAVLRYLESRTGLIWEGGEFPTPAEALRGALPLYEYGRDARGDVMVLGRRDTAFVDPYPLTAAAYRALVGDERVEEVPF
jgi:hypothetical protein